MLANILVTGLMNAGVYALLAVGFSLIFGAARIINLSHTAFYMAAAFAMFYLTVTRGLNVYLAIPIALAIVAVLGTIVYKLIIDPLREHEATVLIVTLATAILFQEGLLLGFGGHYRGVPSLWAGYTTLLGVRVTYQYLLTLAVVIVASTCLWALLQHSRLGIAIRATAQDREVANLMGMDVSRVATVAMVIGVVLAGVAGVMVAPIYVLEPHMWQPPMVTILAVVVLGGLGSIKGSFIGAVILALAEVLVVFLVPQGAFLKAALALTLMLAILLIRPEGLFGVLFEGER
ncbi:MAG: branched-chain amino acid ABC transporter permease [bacterium]|nr:branched-chain amino acid ABC transporter permease [bacterium]